jgi:glutamate synthase domain-containing protein 1
VHTLAFPDKLKTPKIMFKKQGLYRPEYEHENCGAGFICNLNGEKTNQIIHDALEILIKLKHRGGVSSDGVTGDGAGSAAAYTGVHWQANGFKVINTGSGGLNEAATYLYMAFAENPLKYGAAV